MRTAVFRVFFAAFPPRPKPCSLSGFEAYLYYHKLYIKSMNLKKIFLFVNL